MNPVFIENQQQFDQHFNELSSESILAVDTEFFRETTYFPHLGLVQVANSKIVACIDPLAFDAKASIASLLLNQDITKVFHSCSQDMEVLKLYLGELPCPILDTQIAASLIDESEQVSYAKLVEAECGVSLDKSQTRTNWLKRPLTAKQLEYAADDVFYLYQLIKILSTKLTTLGRNDWFLEDCQSLCDSPEQYEPNLKSCGTRVKGTHKMPAFELAIINSVANWREQLAIDKDLTRRRALPDNEIVLIAETRPESVAQLSEIGQITRYLKPDEIESLMSTTKQSYLIPESDWPVKSRNRLAPEDKDKLKILHNFIDKKAADLKISATTLCSRKEITSLFNNVVDSRALRGWRLEIFGNELRDMLGN